MNVRELGSDLHNPRLAYLVDQFPGFSNVWLTREIHQLRLQGFDLTIFSISMPRRVRQQMSADEAAEAAQTIYVKLQRLTVQLRAHLWTFLRRPLSWLAGLFSALQYGRAGALRVLNGLVYFHHAVVIGDEMHRRGLTHLHIHFASNVGLLLRRIFPCTISLTIHGPDEFEDPRGYRLAEKIQAASFVCAISHYARSQLMKVSHYSQWGKIEVAPLGVDPAQFVRDLPAAPHDPFEILFVGRLAAVKALHILIAATEKLVSEGRRVRLRLVGDGPDRKLIESYAEDRGLGEVVLFEGWQNQQQVQEFYRRADVFALASFAEGVPVVLMEAMAMGIPCVATGITGIPELIRSGIDGLLVPPSDTQQLAEALGRLMDDEPLRARLGRAGRERIIEKYNLQKNTRLLARVFRRNIPVYIERPVNEKGTVQSAA